MSGHEHPQETLLIGYHSSDDAAALEVEGSFVLVQTVDFFTPVVDDPETFGAIAAANSISDIYAMGATPILGLAIAGFPSDVLPIEVLQAIFRGGIRKATEAGFPVAGGHTIIDDVPKYGLAVTGRVAKDKLVRNSTARPGDAVYLTKPLGTGIMIAAHRSMNTRLRRLFSRTLPALDEVVSWMMLLNRRASQLMTQIGATAATDVTGYGLVGHLREMCRGAGIGVDVDMAKVTALAGAVELIDDGYLPEGTTRNMVEFRASVENESTESDYTLACDAQTNGGLLIAVAPEQELRLERAFEHEGLYLAKIGRFNDRKEIIRLHRG